jgi:hypothetical protein
LPYCANRAQREKTKQKLRFGFFDKGRKRFERFDTYMMLDTFGIEFSCAW